MANVSRNTVLVGGHPDGVKYIARHLNQYDLKKLQIIPKFPALNTCHYDKLGERLTNYLQDFQLKEPSIDVWSCAEKVTKMHPFGVRKLYLYTNANVPFLLTKREVVRIFDYFLVLTSIFINQKLSFFSVTVFLGQI